MTPIIADTLTVAGAIALVSTIVEYTKFLIDLVIKDQVTNIRVTRLFVFLVALTIVSLPPLQRLGFHLNGDILSLVALAGVVASGAIAQYHLLSKAPLQTPESAVATLEHPNSP